MSNEALKICQLRGGFTESEHPVSAVLCRAGGAVAGAIGPETVTTWRSGAKPFQLLGSLGFLTADTVAELSPKELAVGAASHSGQRVHTEIVSELLARFSLDETALRCGVHWPMHRQSERGLVRSGQEASQLHNNCSGKHSFMAIAAHAAGLDPDYRPPDHPVQAGIRDAIDAHTEGAVRAVVIDGCGAPCFVLSLQGIATAFAKLAEATAKGDGVLGRIGAAMTAHPMLVCGAGRADLALCESATAPLIAKIGAEGLMCVAIPSEGVGVAMKVLSGADDARMPAILAVLDRWFPGLIPPETRPKWCEVRNLVGRLAGERVAIFGAVNA